MQLRLSIGLLIAVAAIVALCFWMNAPAPAEGDARVVAATSTVRTSTSSADSHGSGVADDAPAPAATASSATAGASIERPMAERLLALIALESDPVAREQAAENGAKKIPRALFGAVLSLLQKEATRPGAAEAMRALMLRWAWEEPGGAAAWALESTSGEFRRDALGAVAAGWARQQPRAIYDWAQRLAPDEREWVLLHGASYLARTDLRLFSTWQATLPASRERDQLLADTARLWAGRDPATLAEVVAKNSSTDDGPWREQIAHALAGHLATAGEFADSARIIAALPPGPEQAIVLTGVVNGWAVRDPWIVANWLEGMKDPAARAEFSVLLAGNWLLKNPDEATAWAHALPPGPVADAVARRLAEFDAAQPDGRRKNLDAPK